ncbi:MAG: hypothetical protein D6744_05465 [Planctomycetota bacterium]|nr:MAG: hypothetical protein D6744_05465 [Planctomycetota bacterium]
MSVSAVAAAGSAHAQAEVHSAVAVKALKLANEQQQSAATLLDAAVATAEQIQSHEPGKGTLVDISA